MARKTLNVEDVRVKAWRKDWADTPEGRQKSSHSTQPRQLQNPYPSWFPGFHILSLAFLSGFRVACSKQVALLLAVSEQGVIVLQARPNQLHCRSLSVFHMRDNESNPCCGWLGLVSRWESGYVRLGWVWLVRLARDWERGYTEQILAGSHDWKQCKVGVWGPGKSIYLSQDFK